MFTLSPDEWEIIQLSLKVAFWSVLCSLPLAVAVAVVLARAHFPGKSVFDALVHLPLVLPPVVIGYFLLFVALVRHGVLAFGALAAGVAVALAVLAVAFLPTARSPRHEEPDAWILLLAVAVPVLTLALLGALVAVIPLVRR